MRIGKLRDRIQVQNKGVVGRDPMGGEILDWVTYAEPWAEVEPFHLRSTLVQRRLAGESVSGFRVRTPLPVKIGDRVIHNEDGFIIDELDVSRVNRGELYFSGRTEALDG